MADITIAINPSPNITVVLSGNPPSSGTASWGGITGTLSNQTDLQTALDGKVSKTGDTIEGTFTNSEPLTQIILTGDDTGDDSQGSPLSNSSPRIDLGTYQVSEYRSGEAQKGGYSELLRLRSLDTKAKPTIAWYSDDNKPKSWIVTHYQPQDLQIYANLASFPVTGVDDGLRAYYAEDTGLYYTWNGSAYIALLPNNPEYYYRAIHQHISFETTDTTTTALYTRLGIPYDLDVVPITTANSHLAVTSGDNNGKPFGAFILQGGKTFSSQPIVFYPNSNNAGTVEAWKDSATDNIFTNNTEGLRMRVLADGNADNLVSGQKMLAINAEGLNWLGFNENVVIGGASQYSLGINRSAGVALDVQRRDLGVVNNTEYTIARFTRTDADGFLNIGYIGNGTSIGSYQVRTTNSKDLVFGVTGATTALRIAATTGNVTLSGSLTTTNINTPSVQATTSAGVAIKTNGGSNVFVAGAGGGVNGTFFGNVSMDSIYKIVNHIDPTSAQDVATKNYVDTGLSLKAPLASPTFTGVVTTPQIKTSLQSLTPTGTTQTIDFNNGSIINLTLSSATGTVVLTLSNPQAATTYIIKAIQGATPRNLTFPTGTTQAGGGGVTYTGTASQTDIIAVLYDGTNYFISVSKNYS